MRRLMMMLAMSYGCMLSAQVDTVHVYDGLSISYIQRMDTVMMSVRKWDGLVSIMRSERSTSDFLHRQYELMWRSSALCDSSLAEMKLIVDNYKERSVMYKDMYYSTVHEAQRLTELIAKGSSMVAEDRRRQVWKGVMIGTTIGVVIGAVTAAIILK